MAFCRNSKVREFGGFKEARRCQFRFLYPIALGTHLFRLKGNCSPISTLVPSPFLVTIAKLPSILDDISISPNEIPDVGPSKKALEFAMTRAKYEVEVRLRLEEERYTAEGRS